MELIPLKFICVSIFIYLPFVKTTWLMIRDIIIMILYARISTIIIFNKLFVFRYFYKWNIFSYNFYGKQTALNLIAISYMKGWIEKIILLSDALMFLTLGFLKWCLESFLITSCLETNLYFYYDINPADKNNSLLRSWSQKFGICNRFTIFVDGS